MATIHFGLADIEAAFEKVANAEGITLSDGDLVNYANRVETFLYVHPAKNDLVEAFKKAATAGSLAGDIDTMAAAFPAELVGVRNARLKAEKDKADQAKKKSDAESTRQEVNAKLSNVSSSVTAKVEDVNRILSDVRSKLPAIKSAAATAGVDDIDDDLDTHLQSLEDAAAGLLQCQTDVAKTSSLKTAQAVEKRSLQHLADANTAKIAIDGIEARVNGAAGAAKAKEEKEKQSAKKAKKEKIGKFDRFRSSWRGHLVVIMAFLATMTILFFVFLPFWVQVGAIVIFVVVLGYHAAMWFTGHERRGQNVTAIVTVLAVMIIGILLLFPLAGTGRGSDRSFIPERVIETPTPEPTPTPGVDCWQGVNAELPECADD